MKLIQVSVEVLYGLFHQWDAPVLFAFSKYPDIGCFRVKMQVSNLQPCQFPNPHGGIIPKYEEHLVAAFGPFLLTGRVKERLDLVIFKIHDFPTWDIQAAYCFA